MAFELEALVGHLYVAGGRTIKTTPPGALCEVAPRRAARGREIDTIFVMVLPSGTIAPNTFYEQMALMAAERFFSQGGSVTSALREVLNTLNHNLHEHNRSGRKHYEANMLIAVLRGETLYTARVGAAAIILRIDDEISSVPEKITDDDELFKPPLGVQPIPEIDMGKHEISANTRMLMTDGNLAEITQERLKTALSSDGIETVLDEFKTLVTLQIQLMAVEFVPPEQPATLPAAKGQSTAVIAAEVAAARSKVVADQAAQQAAQAQATLQIQEMNSPRNRLKRRIKNGVSVVSRNTGHFFTAIGSLGGKLFGRDPSAERKKASTIVLTAAFLGLPVIIIGLVMLSWVFNVGQTAYEECVERAANAAEVARTIDSSIPANVISTWEIAVRIVNECQEIRPDVEDMALVLLAQEGRLVIDNLNGITRRDITPIYSWEGANIRRLILQGLFIYALDDATNLVYRVQLGEDGINPIAAQPLANMRAGARLDGLTIGNIIDITYDVERNQLLALDTNGVLVTCPPTVIYECEAQQLLGTENWVNVTRIGVFGVNFYVMDSGGDQIWRYQPVGTTDNYGNPPQEYFQNSGRYDLDSAVDFAIGTIDPIRGKVFILYNDGTVTAHYNGDPEPFVFGNFRQGQDLATVGAQAMFLNNNRIETVFYYVSRRSRTIYETTAAGTFMKAYRAEDEALFERLNAVTANTDLGVVYAASGNAILAFQRAD